VTKLVQIGGCKDGLRSELSTGWVEPWVGLGWVGLGQSADGIGSHVMDPWTTVLETRQLNVK